MAVRWIIVAVDAKLIMSHGTIRGIQHMSDTCLVFKQILLVAIIWFSKIKLMYFACRYKLYDYTMLIAGFSFSVLGV